MSDVIKIDGTVPVLDPDTGSVYHPDDLASVRAFRESHLRTRRGRRLAARQYAAWRRRTRSITGGQTAAPVIPAIPFIASSHEHTEPVPTITQLLVTAGAPQTYEFNLPSYGYVRHLWLDVNITGGTGAAAVMSGDAPWNILDQVTFLDTNGAPIFGPLSGYSTFLSNLFGGYAYQQDPRAIPTFAALNAAGNGRFQIRIPIEISHHDGTGCLGNQNAAAPYRIRLNINAPSAIFTTPPTTLPTVTITPLLEAWSLPNATDAMGNPQAQMPPNYGTIQYWSERLQTGVGTGQNTIPVLRVGGLIRNIVFVSRQSNATGTRDDTVFPSQPILSWDGRQLTNEPQVYRAARSNEVLESPSTLMRPAGVFAYTFGRTNQDRAGDDKPWLWLPTVEATRLEIQGQSAAAGVVNVLVNDIAPGEVNPTQHYVERNATGFHPNPDVAPHQTGY